MLFSSNWQSSEAAVPGPEWQRSSGHLSRDRSAALITTSAIGQQSAEIPPARWVANIYLHSSKKLRMIELLLLIIVIIHSDMHRKA